MMLTISQAVKDGLLRDGVTPYSNVDPIDAADKVMQGKYTFPYVGELPVFNNGIIDWQPIFDTNKASKELWFYSFVFIDYLIKAYVVKNDIKYWEKALELYISYQGWKSSSDESNSKLFNDEHAVTNRSLIFSQFLHVSIKKSDYRIYESLVSELKSHADWLEKDVHYVYNNHGVMMDRALLNIYVQFKEQSNNPLFNADSSLFWLEKALSRLNSMIEKTFDEDGCCTENSPSYHMLNLSLFGAIDSFLRKNKIENGIFNAKLKLALGAANFMVHEDGALPLIGDSEKSASVYVSDSLYKGKYGVGYFPNSGFTVIKKKDFYLSFKCGGQSFSHRHIDDTSITLRVLGLDFICDAGMYSYDNSDKLRRYFVSHKAHSGFFPDSSSGLLFKNYENPTQLAKTTLLTESPLVVSFMGENHYDIKNSFYRRIDCLKSRSESVEKLIISDSFESEESISWTIQYLLHPEVEVKNLGESLLLERNGVRIFLSFSSRFKFYFKIEKSKYSEKYQSAVDTNVLVFSGDSPGLVASTVISLM